MSSSRPLAYLFLAWLAAPAPRAATPPQTCFGCVGTGGTASSSGGSCGGLVTISVEVGHGKCKSFGGPERLLLECRQTQGCATTITRQWSGLPPGTSVEHFILTSERKLTLRPTPSSGSGTSSTTRRGPALQCSSDPRDAVVFVVGSDACNLSARATATCSGCFGDL